MFAKLLVANRGEIAVRVIRACRELGIASVAVYSDADRDALHVRLADEAYPCGPAPARESYLQAERIVAIAKQSGAEAIHPGYGFLSENGAFPDLCAAAGIVYVGPSGDVVRKMGDKVTARRTLAAAGVPIVPGSTERQGDAEAVAFAKQIGFPVMVKASAGGGGRGLRRVASEAELAQALVRARSEARTGFGDDGLYLEKYVEQPRHVELQVLADAHGGVVHLFERECSIQRRHQKLVEEAPACGMTPALRAQMGAAAVAAARAVGYAGAGTVEFLLDASGAFYFLEMNTRIQVEHAVTEMITGVDLVKAMIRVAAGERLPFRQDEFAITGHAIEARLYAEDPARNFLPSPGRVTQFRVPGGPGIRVDAGVDAGSEVSVHYDAMLAKLIAWGRDRAEAIARLAGALAELQIGGVKTTLPFHRWLLAQPGFLAGRYDTGFVDAHFTGAQVSDPERRFAARAAAAYALVRARMPEATCTLLEGKTPVAVAFSSASGEARVRVAGEERPLDLRETEPGVVSLRLGARSFEATVSARPKGVDVGIDGEIFSFRAAE